MKRRRLFLVLATAAFVTLGVERYSLAVPTEIEADGYAGAASGGWACGPRSTATYAGGGGSVRVHPASTPANEATTAHKPNTEGDQDTEEVVTEPYREPDGVTIGVRGGGEYRSFELDAPGAIDNSRVLPEARVLGGAQADLGGDFRYFGFRIGALAFQRWANNDDKSPDTNLIPTVDLRFARRTGPTFLLGFGSFSVPTLLRPGLYTGVGWQEARGFGIEGRVGAHMVFDGQVGLRGDVRGRYAIDDTWAFGIGVAAQVAEKTTPEGTFFVVITP